MESSEPADPVFRRAVRILWPVLALIVLVFSGIYSHLAPVGDWNNQIFGLPAWGEADPGGPYVDAAHQLKWGEFPLFLGHPGSTLILVLNGVQGAYYTVSADAGLSFTEFTARNIATVFFLSKLAMTFLHLVSFQLLFLFARELLRSERAAFFAALGYATSLPVLYYLSRISVEPLAVICFLVAFLSIWRYQELAVESRVGRALCFAGFAAVAAVSGAVSKLAFLGPLPFFLLIYLLVGVRLEGGGLLPFRTRALGLLVFGVVGVVTTLLYSNMIDWPLFFKVWAILADSGSPVDRSLGAFVPGPTPERVFLLSEFILIGLGAVGWCAYLLRYPGKRSRTLWVSAYAGWGLLLWLYRVALIGNFLPFHYFFLTNIVVAVFFGYFTEFALRRLPVRSAGWRGVAFGLVWVALIHAVSIWTVFDSRRFDASVYAPNQPIHALLSRLQPGERLACQRLDPKILARRLFGLHAVGWPLPFHTSDRDSKLRTEFEALFVPVGLATLDPSAEKLFVPALDTTVVSVRSSDLPASESN